MISVRALVFVRHAFKIAHWNHWKNSSLKINTMKNSILIIAALMFVFTISRAQTVMQISGNDCNGVSHDLFSDLDAGKAVILHFFMTCASCPPPAQKIQAMANNILATHPGMISAYALGYTNSYSCSTVA